MVDLLPKINFNPTVQEREARKVNFFQTGQLPPITGGNAGAGGVASINYEVAPKYLDSAESGSFYTNGRGHSTFGAFKPYLA